MTYKFFVAILKFFTKACWGLDIIGLENVPAEGGAIVAGNHTTWFDPVAIAVAIKRPVHFMAKAELFSIPVFGWLIRKAYVFPVKRGLADRDAIRTAQERVGNGHLLGIFPEGTRNRSDEGELLPLQGGAAMISLKTGIPIIPVVVTGVKPMRFRRSIKVVIGSPIILGGPKRATKVEVLQANELISNQFSSLLRRNN